MQTQKPAADSRFESLKAAKRFHDLKTHPHLQAEAIAHHYSKLVAMAMTLRELVDSRKHYQGSTIELDECIDRLKCEIIAHHRDDFGIELDWDKSPLNNRPVD